MNKWIIFFGTGVVVWLLMFLLYRPQEPIQEETARQDSITIAIHEIKRVQAREKALVSKIHSDSIKSARRDSVRVRLVAGLERRLLAINRQRATPDALDSIRRVLFPDGTEIDSTYAMPLRDARECLQAAERLPVALELVDTLKGQIVSLRAEKARDWAAFQALDSGRVAEIEQDRIIIRNTGEQLAVCQRKRRGFWAGAVEVLKDIGKVGAGFLLGRATK